MKKSRFTEEQITYVLRQADSGTPVPDVCRGMGISEATFYVWKKKYASMGVSELRKLRQLEDENVSAVDAVDPGSVSDQLRTGVSAGWDQPRRLVQEEPSEGPDRAAHADPGDRHEPTTLWLRADSHRATA